jgi:glutamine synthetase
VKAGSEFEYYVLKDSWEDSARAGWGIPQRYGYYNEDYHLLQATKAEPLHRLLRNQMTEARVPIEFSKGEAAPGQHEVNIRYDHVLESADRSVIFKHGAKEIAYLNGWGITFMAKPDHTWIGSSCHIHSSLWRDGESAFAGESDVFRSFLAGQIACARELAIFFAPNVNSYKRYAAGSWAPTTLAWGRDNRTCGFRIVGSGPALRAETRIPGADANPYLAFAALLAAGLYGIEQGLELGPPFEGNAYESNVERFPSTLREAIDALERGPMARTALGDDVVEHYLNYARTEQELFDRVVTCYERERFFERG